MPPPFCGRAGASRTRSLHTSASKGRAGSSRWASGTPCRRTRMSRSRSSCTARSCLSRGIGRPLRRGWGWSVMARSRATMRRRSPAWPGSAWPGCATSPRNAGSLRRTSGTFPCTRRRRACMTTPTSAWSWSAPRPTPKRVWHEVTNADQVRVDITFANGGQAGFLQSDIASVMKPKWYVLGTRGAVVGEWRDEPVPADFPARVKVYRPADGGGTNEEVLALPVRADHGFYRNLADHLERHEALAGSTADAPRTEGGVDAPCPPAERRGAARHAQLIVHRRG